MKRSVGQVSAVHSQHVKGLSVESEARDNERAAHLFARSTLDLLDANVLDGQAGHDAQAPFTGLESAVRRTPRRLA